jgi:hypothetical protein
VGGRKPVLKGPGPGLNRLTLGSPLEGPGSVGFCSLGNPIRDPNVPGFVDGGTWGFAIVVAAAVNEVMVMGSAGRLGTGLLRTGQAVAALAGGMGPGLMVGRTGEEGATSSSSGVWKPPGIVRGSSRP